MRRKKRRRKRRRRRRNKPTYPPVLLAHLSQGIAEAISKISYFKASEHDGIKAKKWNKKPSRTIEYNVTVIFRALYRQPIKFPHTFRYCKLCLQFRRPLLGRLNSHKCADSFTQGELRQIAL